VHNALFDVWMVVVFGVFGYFFRKLQYPLAPMVLAIVLGDNAEAAFRQAMLFSQGDLRIFFATPLVGSICTLALVLLFWPLIALGLQKARGR
jgi:putative tricarboxylic transport membrane protein